SSEQSTLFCPCFSFCTRLSIKAHTMEEEEIVPAPVQDVIMEKVMPLIQESDTLYAAALIDASKTTPIMMLEYQDPSVAKMEKEIKDEVFRAVKKEVVGLQSLVIPEIASKKFDNQLMLVYLKQQPDEDSLPKEDFAPTGYEKTLTIGGHEAKLTFASPLQVGL